MSDSAPGPAYPPPPEPVDEAPTSPRPFMAALGAVGVVYAVNAVAAMWFLNGADIRIAAIWAVATSVPAAVLAAILAARRARRARAEGTTPAFTLGPVAIGIGVFSVTFVALGNLIVSSTARSCDDVTALCVIELILLGVAGTSFTGLVGVLAWYLSARRRGRPRPR